MLGLPLSPLSLQQQVVMFWCQQLHGASVSFLSYDLNSCMIQRLTWYQIPSKSARASWPAVYPVAAPKPQCNARLFEEASPA